MNHSCGVVQTSKLLTDIITIFLGFQQKDGLVIIHFISFAMHVLLVTIGDHFMGIPEISIWMEMPVKEN